MIYDRYRQRIFAYTRQMLTGSRGDAEDAMQDVFLRAYGALRNNDRPVACGNGCTASPHNRCIDQLRQLPGPEDVFEMSRAVRSAIGRRSERRAGLRQLVSDLRALPDQQRSAAAHARLDGSATTGSRDALGVRSRP